MKRLKFYAIPLLIIFSAFCQAQKSSMDRSQKDIIFLDSISRTHKVKSYTLNTKNLYGINTEVNMYNVFNHSRGKDRGILLISVLPDFITDIYQEEPTNWAKVDYSSVQDRIMKDEDFVKIISSMNTVLLNPEQKTMKYRVLKKEGGDYFLSIRGSLVEYFRLEEYPPPLNVPYGVISISGNPVTVQEMLEMYKEKLPQKRFPSDIRFNPIRMQSPKPQIQRFYLSKKYKVKNEQAYQFWTLDVWNTVDGYNLRRGIDRFVYIPEKGIVGGSYDFYFEYYLGQQGKISYEKLWDNVLNEKVMLAEELK